MCFFHFEPHVAPICMFELPNLGRCSTPNLGFKSVVLISLSYLPKIRTKYNSSLTWHKVFFLPVACRTNFGMFSCTNVDLWFVNAPWIKLFFHKINNKCPLNKANFFGPKPRFAQMGLIFFSMLYLRWLSCTNSYCQLIRSYLDNFKFSKIMVALFYSKPLFKIIQNQSQINSSRVPPMRCLGTN